MDGIIEFAKGLAAGGLSQDLEDVGGMGRGQTLEEGLDSGREFIIERTTVGPDGVSARLWDLFEFENGERGGGRLEGDVRVPRVVGVESSRRAEIGERAYV